MNNPDHYKNEDDYFKILSDGMRQASLRSSSNWMNIDFTEWYTKIKSKVTKKQIAALDTNKEMQVRKVSINDIADKVGLEERGESDKVLRMIFY